MANAGGGLLPAEYQQVEWLGTKSLSEYIDTGIIIPDNYERLEIKITPTTGVNSNYRYFGTWAGNTSIMGLSNTGPLDRLRVGNNNYYDALTQIGVAYTIDLTADNGSLIGTYCGVEMDTTYSGSVHTGNKESVFAQSGSNTGYANVYYYRLHTSSGLVRDFVPCYRKSDGKTGFFDLVSNTLFTDAGRFDQEFNIGPNV